MPLWTLPLNDEDVKERIDNGELNPEDVKYMNSVKSLSPETDIVRAACRTFGFDA